jgi:hypothetical protein
MSVGRRASLVRGISGMIWHAPNKERMCTAWGYISENLLNIDLDILSQTTRPKNGRVAVGCRVRVWRRPQLLADRMLAAAAAAAKAAARNDYEKATQSQGDSAYDADGALRPANAAQRGMFDGATPGTDVQRGMDSAAVPQAEAAVGTPKPSPSFLRVPPPGGPRNRDVLWQQSRVRDWYNKQAVQLTVATLIFTNFLLIVVETEIDPYPIHLQRYPKTWLVLDNAFNIIFLVR